MATLDTRARLISTAARLFHERGYAATGIATILREAELHAGSLYHYFPGKEDLLLATLQWRLETLRPMLTDPVEALTPDPIERVFGLLERYRQGLQMTACTRGCPIGNLALELSDGHPRARQLLQANLRTWVDVVAGWLDDAGERLPGDVDRRELAGFVLAVMEGGLMQARAQASTAPFEAAVAQLRRHFEGLFARAAVVAAGGAQASPTPPIRRLPEHP